MYTRSTKFCVEFSKAVRSCYRVSKVGSRRKECWRPRSKAPDPSSRQGGNMKISRHSLTWMIVLPITFALVTSGCATKKYVRTQVDVVNQRVSQVETKTNEQMASLTNKHDEDISQVKERIMTTENKVAENAAAIRQTNATATQAMQTAQSNESKISANAAAVSKLEAA